MLTTFSNKKCERASQKSSILSLAVALHERLVLSANCQLYASAISCFNNIQTASFLVLSSSYKTAHWKAVKVKQNQSLSFFLHSAILNHNVNNNSPLFRTVYE